MKKILVLLAALMFVGTANAQVKANWTSSGAVISAVGSTTTGTYPSSSGLDVSGATAVMVHVTSASTSSSTVLIEGSAGGAFWYPLATITNASSTGELWAGPAPVKLRLNLSAHASGTITAWVATRQMASDPIGSEWKKFDVNGLTASLTAITATAITDSGLTSGRCPLVTTGGLFTDSSAATCSASLFTLPSAKISDLTSGRVPYASTGGQLVDASTFTFAAGALSVGTSVATTRFLSTGTAPAVANVGANSCGTTAATIAGKDQVHVITVGATSGTECRVTFNVAFANAPVCTVTGQTATDLHVVTTTTTSTITGTLTAGEKIYETCLGY